MCVQPTLFPMVVRKTRPFIIASLHILCCVVICEEPVIAEGNLQPLGVTPIPDQLPGLVEEEGGVEDAEGEENNKHII